MPAEGMFNKSMPSCPGCRRFLAPLQPVDVWVELEVPRDSGQGVAQVGGLVPAGRAHCKGIA